MNIVVREGWRSSRDPPSPQFRCVQYANHLVSELLLMWVNQLIEQLTKTFQHERQGQDCTKKTELAKQKPYSHSLVSIILDPCAEFLNGIRSSFEMFQHVNPCHLISCSQVYEFKKGEVRWPLRPSIRQTSKATHYSSLHEFL